MFPASVYINRRKLISSKIGSGLILLPGNDESPMNYLDNTYHYRQDSTFLYYFGVDQPGLYALIDIDQNKEYIFGDELTVEDIVWMGAMETIAEKAKRAGVKEVLPLKKLQEVINNAIAGSRTIHYLPQYRADNLIKMNNLMGIIPQRVNDYASISLIKAIAEQRTVKSPEEIAEIEKALDISFEMYDYALKNIKDGMYEREVAGMIEGIALSKGNGVSFPTIFSVHGEILHNHHYGNVMKNGQLVVLDSGAESELHYASDITRTFPVSGKFSAKQKEIYQIVLNANENCINAVRPGLLYKEIHTIASETITGGLRDLGFLKGNVEEIVQAGAHALFFPHGIGHLLGLDVHDLENLGEHYTGYDETIERSTQFGLSALRFGKKLKPGNILTVEPGIYFIPQLIAKWESEKKFLEYINYDMVKSYLDFGGIRIEDNVLVTDDGYRVLGKPIPKSVDDIENVMGLKHYA
jgi:Xaa-Pro aminopeptidase